MSEIEEIRYDTRDLEPVIIPVSIGEKRYELHEADEGAACVYSNESIKGATFGPDGKMVRMEGIGNVQPLLVSLCLREALVDDQGEPTGVTRKVSVQEIKKWKPRVVRHLFNAAKEISNLGEEEETEEGLLKQREEIDRKLEKLQEGESAAKN